MKEVRICEAMKSPVGTLSDGTVLPYFFVTKIRRLSK